MLSSHTRRAALALPVLLWMVLAPTARAQSGEPDPTFNGTGLATTSIGQVDAASHVLALPDGDIVLAGFTGDDAASDLALTRYNADGTLDASFGGGDGVATADLDGNEFAAAAALQPDGKIVVVGYGGSVGFLVARFNADGTLDTSFGGGDGWLTDAFGSAHDEATDVALQPDGKIVVVGYTARDAALADVDWAVARYETDGTADLGFGTAGKRSLDFAGAPDFAYGVALQSDGKIVVAGSAIFGGGTSQPFTAARLNPDGSTDAGFGAAGVATLDVSGGAYSYAHTFDVALKAGGEIVLAGAAWDDQGNPDVAAAQFTPSGAPDPAFGGGSGWTVAALDSRQCAGRGCEQANAVGIQADGQIVVAGFVAATDDDYRYAVVRFSATGTLDDTFAAQGVYTLDAGGGVAADVAFQPDNLMLVAGGYGEDFGVIRLGSGQPLPVELTSFTAVANGPAAVLSWQTSGETNNAGFAVEMRNARPETRTVWQQMGFVSGAGTTLEQQSYRFSVDALPPGHYAFRLRQEDLDGALNYSPEVELSVDAPRVLSLDSPRPNPAGGATEIRFSVPAAGPVTLTLYDALGREVAVLADGHLQAGPHAAPVDASLLPSGLYVYHLISGAGTLTKTLTIAR
jgi:uncharacterized delta-60 repeat protein